MAHRAAGLPYLVQLRHPTTGGVFASWGSLGHVTVAEPGALVGFLGPRVYEGVTGMPFPEDVQTAENPAAKGVIDAVVSPEELPGLVDLALAVLVDGPGPRWLPRREPALLERRTPVWASIARTRDQRRAGVRDLVRHGATGTLRLRGSDEGAIAGEIARCIGTLATMTVPTLSVLLGQGCGGGALALLPAATVIAAEHAWLSPLPPEGASVIVHGDVRHAAEMAAAQRVGAAELLADGTVQRVVPELDADSAEDLAVAVAAEIGAQLSRMTR